MNTQEVHPDSGIVDPVALHYRAMVLQCSHPGSVDEPDELVMALWTDDPAPIRAGMTRAQRVALWADLEALADRLDPWITHLLTRHAPGRSETEGVEVGEDG
ncbi:MAG: hypothetical protein ACTH2Q_11815 [Propionibacteriaceae bacterium]